MLVLQQNYGKEYKYTIAVFEADLGLETSIVCIQELFWEIIILLMQGLIYTGYLELTTKRICEF